MNEPGYYESVRDPTLGAPVDEPEEAPPRPRWIERIRPMLPWLALLIPIVAIAAAGLPFGGWRSLPELVFSTDPRTLLPGMRPDLEPLTAAIPRWLITAAVASAVGAVVWAWRGGTAGYGFFASNAAFWLSFFIESARWLKPGQLPDFRDPVIAAIVAPVVWRLLRFLPDQPVTPLPRHGPWRTRRRVLFRFLLASCLLGFTAAAVWSVPAIDRYGYAPAQVAGLIATLPDGRTGLSATAAQAVSGVFDLLGFTAWFRKANALSHPSDVTLPRWTGAGETFDGVLPSGRLRSVTTTEALRQAVDTAEPGDVILLQPGAYPLRGNYILFRRGGTPAAPITLRAPRLGLAVLESELGEALKVAAPHWRFENLVLRGVCTDDSGCDNGFHIVGEAEDTVLHNLRVEDFNAQIKINGEGGKFPDNGRIENTTLIDNHVRQTRAPVTPIDLVGANGWNVQDSLIADFVKAGGNAVSYGAFAKGASRGTIFTRDTILCEWKLHGAKSQTIGLSFGGGGTEPSLGRDGGASGYEAEDGLMADNLIAFCSDDGIYLNRAANSVLRHNTLIGTSGIDVRFVESTARIEANLVDGAIRPRDGGLLWGGGNESVSLLDMFLGSNPVRGFFVDPARLNLDWRRLPVLVKPDPGIDLCGSEWTEPAPAGAFQDFHRCAGAEPDATTR